MPWRSSGAYSGGAAALSIWRLQVVLAARCRQHVARLPVDGAGERVVGRGVTRVQGEHQVGWLGRLVVGDRP